jgi:hypothetical protein
MKRCSPWLLVGFVLAILLIRDLRPDRPTRVFLDSPIGRAPCLDVSRLFVPAVAVMVSAVKPAKFSLKFSLHREARRSRAGPDECLSLLSNFSLGHAPLRADDTGPPWIDFRGPPVLVRTAPRLKLQGPADPPATPKGVNYPPNPRKPGLPQKIRVLQRVIFTTGFS